MKELDDLAKLLENINADLKKAWEWICKKFT